VSRSVLEKQQRRSAPLEKPTVEDDFAQVLECIETEPVSDDLMNLARKLDNALAQQKQRKSPN
jgi:hypothetical protein